MSLLGLLGVALLGAGVWFSFQGGPISGVLMVLAAGGMLAGCAWWLLFLAPPQAEIPQVRSVVSSPVKLPAVQVHEPVQIVTPYQRWIEQSPEQLATPEELRAALRGIGLMRIAGSSWQEAVSDERWANFCVYLHCERDKLDSSPDDVDGLYLTREDAEAAVARSPQLANYYTWKVFVATVRLASVIEDRKALPRLVSAIKRELLALPDCPEPVALKGWSRDDKKAWLDASGQNIVLFEDENALDGPMYTRSEQTGEFRTDDGAGLFDYTGAVIVPPHFEEVEYFYGNLTAAKLNGRWGFIDRDAQWKIEPQFLELGALSFYNSEGDWALVRTEQGWGAIDRQGREVVKPAWDTLESGPDKSFRVTRDGKCGYINAAGVCVAGFQTEPYWLHEYNTFPAEALLLRQEADRWGKLFALADRDGRRLTGFDFVRLFRPSEGLVVAEVKQEDGSTHSGFIDFTGAWVIPPRFDMAFPFSEGLAEVCVDNHQWGYINHQGEVVIACQFEDAYPFREGLAAVQTGKYPNRHYGFIDTSGNWVIQPQFDEVGNVFSQGMAAVKLDDWWGYIGRDGKWAIAPAFSRVWPFSEAGHACVSAPVGNDKWLGMIDRSGQWLLPPSYNGIRDARQVEFGNTGLQWIAAALDTNSRWGGVVLSTSEANRKIVVPFECYSSDEVYRVLERAD